MVAEEEEEEEEEEPQELSKSQIQVGSQKIKDKMGPHGTEGVHTTASIPGQDTTSTLMSCKRSQPQWGPTTASPLTPPHYIDEI